MDELEKAARRLYAGQKRGVMFLSIAAVMAVLLCAVAALIVWG